MKDGGGVEGGDVVAAELDEEHEAEAGQDRPVEQELLTEAAAQVATGGVLKKKKVKKKICKYFTKFLKKIEFRKKTMN